MLTLKRANAQDYNRDSLYAPHRKPGTYLYDRTQLTCEVPQKSFSIPLNIDTEFDKYPVELFHQLKNRLGVTCQIRGINRNEGRILTYPEVAAKLPRFPIMTSGFSPVDYLKLLGEDVSLKHVETVPLTLPVVEFVLYGHFLLAELMMIVSGEYKVDFLLLAAEQSKNKPRFEMNRRLRAVEPGTRGGDNDSVKLPWILTLNNVEYAVKVGLMDTGALHGMASYKNLCAAAGLLLTDKDNFSSDEKARMLAMAIERQVDFDAYSLGDLLPYDILEKNAENFKTIYKSLGVEEFFEAPKLTIGSTVKDLFAAALCKFVGVNKSNYQTFKAFQDHYLTPASAGHLREDSKSTAALCAKVEGGRCRNNQPNRIFTDKLIVDTDISGCYGEGQRNQLYFLGKPEVLSFDTRSKCNDYWTLRKFIKMYGDDLVSGGWFAKVSTSKPLVHPQDFFASWFLTSGAGEDIMSKYVARMGSDTESTNVEFNEEDGTLKLLNYEILNGTLNHDGLQWIMHVASPKQRTELLDNLHVKAALIYPASWRVDSFEALEKEHQQHKDKNTRSRVGSTRKKLRADDGECHAWYGINLGELIVDDLISNRKLHPKLTPLNTLFKLNINTLYGDMTSKFFMSANVVVGNNITARARALAWYMEKGLNGFQTITDGCAFELNKVVYPREGYRVTALNLVNLYRDSDPISNRRLGFAPLGGQKNIKVEWTELEQYNQDSETIEKSWYPGLILDDGTDLRPYQKPDALPGKPEVISPAMKWVDREAMKHLQTLFKNVDVLHGESTSLRPKKDENGKPLKQYFPRIGQFELEGKGFYDSGTFHGSANYQLENPNGKNLKMRAYETKKPHWSVETKELAGELFLSTRYDGKDKGTTPASDFIKQLHHPSQVTRQVPFYKQAILKMSDYKNRLEHWQSLGLEPGDSFYKPGMMREYSLSQFTFQNWEQYRNWEKLVARAKEKTGQSLETYFVDVDGLLDYAAMIAKVDAMIIAGVLNPFAELDPEYKKKKDHPHHKTYESLKTKLKTPEVEQGTYQPCYDPQSPFYGSDY